MLRVDLAGPAFDAVLNAASVECQIPKEQARKNPFALRSIIERANAQGRESQALRDIVQQIVGRSSQM